MNIDVSHYMHLDESNVYINECSITLPLHYTARTIIEIEKEVTKLIQTNFPDTQESNKLATITDDSMDSKEYLHNNIKFFFVTILPIEDAKKEIESFKNQINDILEKYIEYSYKQYILTFDKKHEHIIDSFVNKVKESAYVLKTTVHDTFWVYIFCKHNTIENEIFNLLIHAKKNLTR